MTVRAELPNPERVLVDGQFVGVRVERGEPERVLAVPQASLQLNQAGPYVLVVGGDNKVEARRVTLGAVDGAQVVVQEWPPAGRQGDRRGHPEGATRHGGRGNRGAAGTTGRRESPPATS